MNLQLVVHFKRKDKGEQPRMTRMGTDGRRRCRENRMKANVTLCLPYPCYPC